MEFIDLLKQVKPSLNFTMPDNEATNLSILLPTKAISDALPYLGELITKAATGKIEEKELVDIFDIVSKILSRNSQRITITKEKVEACMNTSDAVDFLSEYYAFITYEVDRKN